MSPRSRFRHLRLTPAGIPSCLFYRQSLQPEAVSVSSAGVDSRLFPETFSGTPIGVPQSFRTPSRRLEGLPSFADYFRRPASLWIRFC
jgi:hypothetical protein